jgi:DNA-binding NarL/FixJ family response regulator
MSGCPYVSRVSASPYSASSGAAMIAPISGTLLVVDDDPVFRSLAGACSLPRGSSFVGEAESVATALAAAHELRPDAVLVDVGLPDGDGVALARELTALPWRPRVVLTSTDPKAASLDDVRASSAGAFVPKDDLPRAPSSACSQEASGAPGGGVASRPCRRRCG